MKVLSFLNINHFIYKNMNYPARTIDEDYQYV